MGLTLTYTFHFKQPSPYTTQQPRASPLSLLQPARFTQSQPLPPPPRSPPPPSLPPPTAPAQPAILWVVSANAPRPKILEDLEDASNELMLSDEEQIRYVVGECFVHLDKEVAEARLQGMADAVKDEVQQLVGEVDGTQLLPGDPCRNRGMAAWEAGKVALLECGIGGSLVGVALAQAKMKELKALLYGKFGTSINL
ncbi:hypothetical protein V8C86DRAFT_3028919 [Haematococcus lacustris]